MQGVFPILVTPFDDDERVDEDSLRSVVEFNISAGVHGLGIALGSEILKLTEPERSQVVSIVVDQTRGRVPIVVNTGAQANLTAARRGGIGTMPWPSQPHAFVEIWNAWQAGNERHAIDIHEREIAPLARLSTAGLRLGHTIHKELLRRRGVIRSAHVRAPSEPLDDITMRELDTVCERLGIGSVVA